MKFKMATSEYSACFSNQIGPRNLILVAKYMFLGLQYTMRYSKILLSVILLCYNVIMRGKVLNICKKCIYFFSCFIKVSHNNILMDGYM